MRVREALLEGRRALAGPPLAPGPSPREAALLLAHTLGLSEPGLLAQDDQALGDEALARYRHLIDRRRAGEPAAYLLGQREFWGRRFEVDARVLIPRPESEHLIEESLRLALPDVARVLDLGTGSGCLAVTLALERPAWRVMATDASLAALAVARRNAGALGAIGRITLAAADLTAGLRLDRFDLVVCNPPYVDRDDAPSLPREVAAFEPAAALYAGENGLAVMRRLFTASAALPPGAAVVVELGAGQAERAAALAAAAGLRVERVARDLRGIPRVLVAARP